MKDHEIQALREADTLMAVTAMIECRHVKEQTEREQARLQSEFLRAWDLMDRYPALAASF